MSISPKTKNLVQFDFFYGFFENFDFFEKSTKINFDRFVMNEIGSGNSNFIVPTLSKPIKTCNLFYLISMFMLSAPGVA